MTNNNYFSDFISLTKHYANNVNAVQGAGGNTSVKINNQLYIKASGYTFEQVTEHTGFSVLNYLPIKNAIVNDDSIEIINNLITQNIAEKHIGGSYPKPSMETGFHAILNTFVLHTHSVYSNLINANSNIHSLVNLFVHETKISSLIIDYITPGTELALDIKTKIKDQDAKIIFLQNHGVIIHAETQSECIFIHNTLDNWCKSYFNVDLLQIPKITEIASCTYLIFTEWIQEYVRNFNSINQLCKGIFPDQLVFLNEKIEEAELLKTNEGLVIKNTNHKQAKITAEIVYAWFFIFHHLKKKKHEINYIPTTETAKLNKMPEEIHRKNLH